MSNSLWPHGLQYTRLPCPSLSPRVYSYSCPLGQWCHPTNSPSVTPFSTALNLSQHQCIFEWVCLRIRWPKYWSFSFSISPSNEYPGLISFRMDWLDLLAVQILSAPHSTTNLCQALLWERRYKNEQDSVLILKIFTVQQALICWSPEEKSRLIKKDPDAGKDWRQKKGMTKDEMASPNQ